MLRLLIGALVAAALMFAWGFVFWTVLPMSNSVLKTLPDQETLVDQLKAAIPETGVYMVPAGAGVDLEDETLAQRHAEGPIATLIYRKEGAPLMGTAGSRVLLNGFLHMLASAFIAGIVVAASESNTYFSRVMLIFWVGVFCAVWAQLTLAVWWYFPLKYCLLYMAYDVSSCLVMGLVLGGIVRPARLPAEA